MCNAYESFGRWESVTDAWSSKKLICWIDPQTPTQVQNQFVEAAHHSQPFVEPEHIAAQAVNKQLYSRRFIRIGSVESVRNYGSKWSGWPHYQSAITSGIGEKLPAEIR